MRTRPSIKVTQPTPDDLVSSLLDFIRRKFYEGHPVPFAKDRQHLLKWVVLWPATWFNSRGVTVPPARYKEITESVLMDAIRFGQPSDTIKYLPAYLKHVLVAHFRHHGEAYYDEAKSARSLAEHAVLVAGQMVVQRAPDAVRELAAAARLLKPRKAPSKPPIKSQLTLL
jgi:hypothetical protein